MTQVALRCAPEGATARHGGVICRSYCTWSRRARRQISAGGVRGMAHRWRWAGNPGTDVSDETTRNELARIYDNPAERGDLLAYAARFFGNSTRRTVLGVDAHWLVGAAIEKVLKAGFPDSIEEPVAYLKTTIKRTWIDKHRQHQILDRQQPKIEEKYGQPDEHDFTDRLIGDLSEDATSQAIAQQFETFLSRHRPPIPEIGRALRDHPELTVAEIADLVDTSERSVYRAKTTLKRDADMRALLDRIDHDTVLDDRRESP